MHDHGVIEHMLFLILIKNIWQSPLLLALSGFAKVTKDDLWTAYQVCYG
jgi:hypothetical protein